MKGKRRNKGFTLVEVLAVVLILVLVTSVVVAGIPVARRAYRRVTDQANAQVVLSTAMTSLRDELWTAAVVSVIADGTVIYTCHNGRSGAISPDGVDSLVGGSAVLDGLHVTYDGADFVDGVVILSGLSVDRDGDELASIAEFCIRVAAGG